MSKQPINTLIKQSCLIKKFEMQMQDI